MPRRPFLDFFASCSLLGRISPAATITTTATLRTKSATVSTDPVYGPDWTVARRNQVSFCLNPNVTTATTMYDNDDCFPLVAVQQQQASANATTSDSIGTVCLHRTPDHLNVTYRTNKGWTMVRGAFWMGNNRKNAPLLEVVSGNHSVPRTSHFPYKYKALSSERHLSSSWTRMVPLDPITNVCPQLAGGPQPEDETFLRLLSAHAVVEQESRVVSAFAVHNATRVLTHVDTFFVVCHCRPAGSTSAVQDDFVSSLQSSSTQHMPSSALALIKAEELKVTSSCIVVMPNNTQKYARKHKEDNKKLTKVTASTAADITSNQTVIPREGYDEYLELEANREQERQRETLLSVQEAWDLFVQDVMMEAMVPTLKWSQTSNDQSTNSGDRKSSKRDNRDEENQRHRLLVATNGKPASVELLGDSSKVMDFLIPTKCPEVVLADDLPSPDQVPPTTMNARNHEVAMKQLKHQAHLRGNPPLCYKMFAKYTILRVVNDHDTASSVNQTTSRTAAGELDKDCETFLYFTQEAFHLHYLESALLKIAPQTPYVIEHALAISCTPTGLKTMVPEPDPVPTRPPSAAKFIPQRKSLLMFTWYNEDGSWEWQHMAAIVVYLVTFMTTMCCLISIYCWFLPHSRGQGRNRVSDDWSAERKAEEDLQSRKYLSVSGPESHDPAPPAVAFH